MGWSPAGEKLWCGGVGSLRGVSLKPGRITAWSRGGETRRTDWREASWRKESDSQLPSELSRALLPNRVRDPCPNKRDKHRKRTEPRVSVTQLTVSMVQHVVSQPVKSQGSVIQC